jgi:hypothetical protein
VDSVPPITHGYRNLSALLNLTDFFAPVTKPLRRGTHFAGDQLDLENSLRLPFCLGGLSGVGIEEYNSLASNTKAKACPRRVVSLAQPLTDSSKLLKRQSVSKDRNHTKPN